MSKICRNSNAFHVKTALDDFFIKWVNFLQPFHGLSGANALVLASLLKYRHYLVSMLLSEKEADETLLGKECKEVFMEENHMSSNYLEVALSRLRKAKVIVNDRIDKKFIPILELGSNQYNLIINFELYDK